MERSAPPGSPIHPRGSRLDLGEGAISVALPPRAPDGCDLSHPWKGAPSQSPEDRVGILGCFQHLFTGERKLHKVTSVQP